MSAWKPTEAQCRAALRGWYGQDIGEPQTVDMIADMRRALIAGVGDEVSRLRAGLSAPTRDLAAHLDQLAAERSRITAAAQAEVVELRAKLADCEAQLGPLAADLWHANRVVRDRLRDAERAARSECAAMRSERDALRAQCNRTAVQYNRLAAQFNRDAMVVECDRLRERLSVYESAFDGLRDALDELPAEPSEPPSPQPLVLPGVTIQLTLHVATEYTRVVKLFVTDAHRWQVDGVDVGNRAELVGTISAPALMNAVGPEVTWDVPPGVALIMRLRNVTRESQPEPTVALDTVGTAECMEVAK